MGSTRRSFTDEYKRDAVALVTDGGYSVADVAKKLDISDTTRAAAKSFVRIQRLKM